MKQDDVAYAAGSLGSLMRAGVTITEVLGQMVEMQPQHAEFWARAQIQVQQGERLSQQLASEWPEAIVSAVRAGEESGQIEAVFAQIKQAIEVQRRVGVELKKLRYPAIMVIVGLLIFVGFMAFVIPGLAKSMGGGSKSAIFQVAMFFEGVVKEQGLFILGGLAIGIPALVSWIKSDAGRESIMDAALNTPMLGLAMRDMLFGVWAKYLALSAAAGIPTTQALRSTAAVLPGELRLSIEAFEADLSLRNLSLTEAANTKQLPMDDPRSKWWPFLIVNAWKLADKSGVVDAEMSRVSPELIEEGLMKMKRVLAVAEAIGMAVAATCIVTPLGAYYIQVFSSIAHAGH